MQKNTREISILKKRILEYLDSQGISKYECYSKTGITNGILSQKNGLSEDNMLKFLSHYSDISTDWLLTGRGDMLKADIAPKIELIQHDEGVSIPIVDISVAAGYGAVNSDYLEAEDELIVPESFVKGYRKHLCVRVKGDSMVPTLQDSSYLVISEVEPAEWSYIPDNHIYVVVDKEGNSYVKRVKNRCNRGFIVCTSDNIDKVNHPNFNLNADEIHGIWHAEWYFTAKMPNINEGYYSRIQKLEDDMEDVKTLLGHQTLLNFKNKQ